MTQFKFHFGCERLHVIPQHIVLLPDSLTVLFPLLELLRFLKIKMYVKQHRRNSSLTLGQSYISQLNVFMIILLSFGLAFALRYTWSLYETCVLIEHTKTLVDRHVYVREQSSKQEFVNSYSFETSVKFQPKLCENVVTRVLNHQTLHLALQNRFNFRFWAMKKLTNLLNSYSTVPADQWDKCISHHTRDSSSRHRSHLSPSIAGGSASKVNSIATGETISNMEITECSKAQNRGWSGMKHNNERWYFLGENSVECPDLRSLKSNISGRKFCWSPELVEKKDCTIFSIGLDLNSNWNVEFMFAKLTSCKIYVFDCRVDFTKVNIPKDLENRVVFLNYCLGLPEQGEFYFTFSELTRITNVREVTFLNLDFQGYEFEILENIIESSKEHFEITHENIFPVQIYVRFHYLTANKEVSWFERDLSPGEIFMFGEYLFIDGGYGIAYRHIGQHQCLHCTDILLVKVVC